MHTLATVRCISIPAHELPPTQPTLVELFVPSAISLLTYSGETELNDSGVYAGVVATQPSSASRSADHALGVHRYQLRVLLVRHMEYPYGIPKRDAGRATCTLTWLADVHGPFHCGASDRGCVYRTSRGACIGTTSFFGACVRLSAAGVLLVADMPLQLLVKVTGLPSDSVCVVERTVRQKVPACSHWPRGRDELRPQPGTSPCTGGVTPGASRCTCELPLP